MCHLNFRSFHLQPSLTPDLLRCRHIIFRPLQLDGVSFSNYLQVPLNFLLHFLDLSRQRVTFLREIRLLINQLFDEFLMTLHDHSVLVLQLFRLGNVTAFVRRHFIARCFALGFQLILQTLYRRVLFLDL